MDYFNFYEFLIGCKSNGTEESDVDAADEIDVSNN